MNKAGALKSIYFISDLHLGAPDHSSSLVRERKVVAFLESIQNDASEIVLLGDVFDFWYELRQSVPKGHVRLLGKLAELCDKGIPVHFFPGNHDLWTFGYLRDEIGLNVHFEPQQWQRHGVSLYLAHGDGLGPGDYGYKFLKKIFLNPLLQWFFSRLHPNFSFGLAQFFSRRSRKANLKKDTGWLGNEKEWLWRYCAEDLAGKGYDYMIFGHRHIPRIEPIPDGGSYVNLGDWISHFTYGKLNEEGFRLEKF
jgi:UDP-2,3-diacylglucosamine hydrolase